MTARQEMQARVQARREVRDRYHRAVEPRPSRFADQGRRFDAWTARADAWGTHQTVPLTIPEEDPRG